MGFLRQPLLHFLALGLLLFALFELTSNHRGQGKTILVDREALLTHLQFRSRAFGASRFDGMLEQLPADERAALVRDYAREEALHREALAMGLDVGDYIIRQRLIQKVEYLARGFGAAEPDEAALKRYYDAHREDYHLPATATFTHVFISADAHPSREAAAGAARSLLQRLEREKVSFADAMGYGDRFAFHKNYVNRSQAFVGSHFGADFAAGIFRADAGRWFGPVESAYGYHLVLLGNRTPGRYPALDEVAGEVARDARQAEINRQTEAAIAAIIASYRVIVDL